MREQEPSGAEGEALVEFVGERMASSARVRRGTVRSSETPDVSTRWRRTAPTKEILVF
jgi:hypothetical protein